ncbi:MAG: HRDC domain-containing protein [Enhygromyxa sp.]
MDTKLLTLRYSTDLGAIDDAPLLALGRDHEILGIREHFFVAQDLPHLLCIVSCRRRQRPAAAPKRPPDRQVEGPPTGDEPKESSPPAAKRSGSGPPPDFDDGQRRLYDLIRRWRAKQAELAGVPRYVVLTNREVELIVRQRPDSLAALRRLPGIGEAKVSRHGESLLELLNPVDPAPRLVVDETEAQAAEP